MPPKKPTKLSKGEIYEVEGPSPRICQPTPDCREYYVKHASAMESYEDLKLIFSNVQNPNFISNNVSLWMNWKFAKQLGIYLLLKVSQYESQIGEIKLNDSTSLANYLHVNEYLQKTSPEKIKKEIEDLKSKLVELSFSCEKCKGMNKIKIPKDLSKKGKGVIELQCQKCGELINKEIDPEKDFK